MSDSDKHARLLARIERGERIESPDDMTHEYRANLIHLMTMQADSELAGGYGYVPWIMKAPGVEEKHAVAQIVKDEIRHAAVMYGLLADLGMDVAAHVEVHDEVFTMRVASDANLGTERITSDKRVNIFYYPIDTWADFVMFNFLMDRGAGHQLEDVKQSSFGPWRREIDRIFKEELTHVAHGDYWVKRFALDPARKPEIQAALDRWWPRVMAIFGRPGSKKNQRYRTLGLKVRDNHQVRLDFEKEVREKAESWGLVIPHWTPNWEKLPEDAVISG